jgi:hypothetical protein
LPARSRIGRTHVEEVGDVHVGAILTAVSVVEPQNHPTIRTTGFQLDLASKPGGDNFDGN